MRNTPRARAVPRARRYTNRRDAIPSAPSKSQRTLRHSGAGLVNETSALHFPELHSHRMPGGEGSPSASYSNRRRYRRDASGTHSSASSPCSASSPVKWTASSDGVHRNSKPSDDEPADDERADDESEEDERARVAAGPSKPGPCDSGPRRQSKPVFVGSRAKSPLVREIPWSGSRARRPENPFHKFTAARTRPAAIKRSTIFSKRARSAACRREASGSRQGMREERTKSEEIRTATSAASSHRPFTTR